MAEKTLGCPECTDALRQHEQGFYICDKCKYTFNKSFVVGYWKGYLDAVNAQHCMKSDGLPVTVLAASSAE